jgi:chromosome segregation ATPase
VLETIGLSKAEIEIEVGGKKLDSLNELLPEKKPDLRPNLWEGEAMIYLGNLLPKIKNPREFKIRLAISDSRPADLEGPGVGYSEWIEIKINKGASSLVRQELREKHSDLKKTIEKAIADVHKAEAKMHQAKAQLRKEEVPERALEAMNEARDKLAEAEKDLTDLSERMKDSVQAHRRDELEETIDKLAEARKEVERAPLQDTDESRKEEIDSAIRNSTEAVDELRELLNEVSKDHPKIEDLAKLEELAQKQDQLAQEAAENAKNADTPPEQDWQKQQEQVENEIREQVRQSPEAKSAALENQAEKLRILPRRLKTSKKRRKIWRSWPRRISRRRRRKLPMH